MWLKGMAYIIRPMRLEDISQVMQIERESFPAPWSATNFRYELLFNRTARYFVACVPLPENVAKGSSWLDTLISRVQRLFSRSEEQAIDDQWVVGYAGLWFMSDEAHLTTIAVRETYQRLGLGELLLISAIELARERNSQFMTLEVRLSNAAAQALYTKYGFTEVGIRRGYYYDTGEDALLMTTEKITSASFEGQFQRLKQAHAERWARQSP
jgi:ribosomal-protein-alanine N-acetyltransferase